MNVSVRTVEFQRTGSPMRNTCVLRELCQRKSGNQKITNKNNKIATSKSSVMTLGIILSGLNA